MYVWFHRQQAGGKKQRRGREDEKRGRQAAQPRPKAPAVATALVWMQLLVVSSHPIAPPQEKTSARVAVLCVHARVDASPL